MNLAVQLQKFAVAVVRFMPLKLADRIACLLALAIFAFNKTGRNRVLDNLRHVFFDEPANAQKVRRYTKNTFVNYARTMLDFLRLDFIDRDDFSVEMIGLDNVKKALQYRRGCVLVTMHLGNWDYAGSYLAAHGVPMSALVEQTEPHMYELYTRHRERLGMRTFPLSRAGIAFLHTIKNNRVLAVLGDRDIGGNGIVVDFFDGRRTIPRGLGDIVIKRQLPVLFGYMALQPYHKKKRYLGWIEPPVFFKSSADDFNKVMVAKFEQLIRQYPDQWMLFQADWIAA
jgi:lauroyl/myristoyl acyltransferase